MRAGAVMDVVLERSVKADGVRLREEFGFAVGIDLESVSNCNYR